VHHVVTRSGGPGDFIGHIAGDDFVFITSRDNADEVCRGICERFDHLIRLYYDPTDRARGHIETKDRFGIQRRFPVMSVSIAAITIACARSYAALAELAAVGKRAAKDIPGSTYVRDGQTLFADANAAAGGPAPAATG
jgi:GGDEF domain-containing protein